MVTFLQQLIKPHRLRIVRAVLYILTWGYSQKFEPYPSSAFSTCSHKQKHLWKVLPFSHHGLPVLNYPEQWKYQFDLPHHCKYIGHVLKGYYKLTTNALQIYYKYITNVVQIHYSCTTNTLLLSSQSLYVETLQRTNCFKNDYLMAA